MPQEIVSIGTVGRQRPQSEATDNQKSGRTRYGRYDEIYTLGLFPGRTMLADEGSYFYVSNPTIDTQVTYGIIAAYTSTAATFAFYNKVTKGVPSAERMYLDFVRIMFTGTPVVPASAVSVKLVAKIDVTMRMPTANFVSSAGAAPALRINNTNGDDQTQSIIDAYAFSGGTMTVPAETNTSRLVGRAMIRNTIPVVQDELICYFGPGNDGASTIGATAGRVAGFAPPFVVGPAQWGLIYIYFPGNAATAGQFEYDFGWVER